MTTKQSTATITINPSAVSKSTPSKHQLQALELALSQHPQIGPFLATASERKREALLKNAFKYIVFKSLAKISTAKGLETLWKESKQKFNMAFEFPELFERRPTTLRGRDFVGELKRLSTLTKDPRFSDAVKALSEHGIIDEKMNFKRWQVPSMIQIDELKKAAMLGHIRDLKKAGQSTRRACAEIAATFGAQAATFDAAIKQLQLLYASSGKKGAA